jgi:hypothetical protein
MSFAWVGITSSNLINANLVDKSLIQQKYFNYSKYVVMILKLLLLVEYLVSMLMDRTYTCPFVM